MPAQLLQYRSFMQQRCRVPGPDAQCRVESSKRLWQRTKTSVGQPEILVQARILRVGGQCALEQLDALGKLFGVERTSTEEIQCVSMPRSQLQELGIE